MGKNYKKNNKEKNRNLKLQCSATVYNSNACLMNRSFGANRWMAIHLQAKQSLSFVLFSYEVGDLQIFPHHHHSIIGSSSQFFKHKAKKKSSSKQKKNKTHSNRTKHSIALNQPKRLASLVEPLWRPKKIWFWKREQKRFSVYEKKYNNKISPINLWKSRNKTNF